MTSCVEETVSGVNSQIGRIKELAGRFPDQELITSMTLFNHRITRVLDRIPPAELREIAFSDYRPDGNTALLDAIGKTVRHLQDTIGDEVARDEASVVVVIFTDGYENASREYTHARVSSLISELELTGKWSFSYIGATLDAVEIAIRLNIRKSNSMRYDVNDSHIAHQKVSRNMMSYLSEKEEGRIKKDFLEEEADEK